MRLSKYYMPTLREDPVDAETVSHKLLTRGAFIRRQASGIYSFLPLGERVIQKIEAIVRESMNNHDAIEISTSIMQPREIWEKSGRWATFGPEMFKLTDRHEREYALGPTAEESFTDLIKGELNSYKQLPLNLYQIVDKFRDEKRPRFGINRSRDFLMKDAYSFDMNEEGLDISYQKMRDAYVECFDKMGLNYKIVEGDTGAMGGKMSHEFIALSESGEGVILFTEDSKYGATDEKARFKINYESEEEKELELIVTAGIKSISDLSRSLTIPGNKCVKAIDLMVEGEPVFVFIPGDRELNIAKLISYLKVPEHSIEMMEDDMIENITHAKAGYTGPINLNDVRIILDRSITKMNNVVIGANKTDHHYINANYGRDFDGEVADDLLLAREGDIAYDDSGVLKSARGIEVGNIFKLGTKYSESLEAYFLDKDGKQQPFIMGSYGIGISRSVSAIVEQYHDERGIIRPTSVAPFEVIITVINTNDESQNKLADEIYNEFKHKRIEVLLDDRKERPGVKFNDRDLIGIPYRITVGREATEEIVEYSTRNTMEDSKMSKLEVIETVIDSIKADLSK